MRCPKCQFDHALQTTECLKCGIIFVRYQAALEAATKPAVLAAPPSPSSPLLPARNDALKELNCRIFAIPLALLMGYLVARTGLRMAAGMLAMVLHESGHAITAWLTGRWAVPLLWVTPHGMERHWSIVLLLTACILFGGFLAWTAERWGWLVAASAVLILQGLALSFPAEALIIFFGDGGAMVLATILMATFYAPRESALYKSWGLRWGLLFVGALSFMHVFLLWTGPFEDLPFGEIEGVNLSDPSLLTEMYGWSVLRMVDRYVLLGKVCLAVLFALYVWGLVSAYREIPPDPVSETRRVWPKRLPGPAE
jgi:hypothetical protein